MIKHGFVEKEMEPSSVIELVKDLLLKENFKITSDDKQDDLLELHAKKTNKERIVLGKVRDVDVIVAGSKGKFEVQVHAGIWGRDLAIPSVEGLVTFGVATALELHSGHEFEMRIWEQIVHSIDPTLKICKMDGMLFKTDEELNKHVQALQAQASTPMMGMGMGMMGMGMMGMMMPGMWI